MAGPAILPAWPAAYRFRQVDVFTDRPFAGNPLAVFPTADGLSEDEMQAIAREMNLSETTFVLPVTDGRRGRGRDVPHADLHAGRRSCRSPATPPSARPGSSPTSGAFPCRGR